MKKPWSPNKWENYSFYRKEDLWEVSVNHHTKEGCVMKNAEIMTRTYEEAVAKIKKFNLKKIA